MSPARKTALVVCSFVILALALACGSGGSGSTPPTPVVTPVAPVAPVAPVVPTNPVLNPTTPVVPAGGDFLAVSMQTRATQFAQGMTPVTPLFRGNLTNAATQDFQAVLQPGKCFKIIGVGGSTVQDLDLFLFDPAGTQVQQDTATDNFPVLGLQEPICPTVAGSYRVQVKMYTGQGEFAMQVFSN